MKSLTKAVDKAAEALLSEEKEMLRGAFEKSGWAMVGAAEALEMTLSGVQNLLSRHPDVEEERRENTPNSNGRPCKPVPTKRELRDTLRRHDWVVLHAAKELKTCPTTLRKWIRLAGLDEECARLGASASIKRAWARRRAA